MTLGTTMTAITASTGITWTRDEIVDKFRKLTGLSTTTDISELSAADWVNDYYVNQFPLEIGVAEFNTEKTYNLASTDSGSFDLAESVLTIDDPVLLDGQPITIYQDKGEFERAYPEDEGYITAPTLSIGVSSAAAVTTAAFKFRDMTGYGHDKATAETALSGDTVPQSKYGAWGLTIDDDGMIAIQEAEDNATGYDSASLALAGLVDASSDVVVLGYVTAINTGGTFIPGTTLLSAATVTDTYTDGDWANRGKPEAVLVAGGSVVVRPKSNDYYTLRIPLTLQRPSALSAGSSVPTDSTWGLAIAAGAAAQYCADTLHDDDAANLALAILARQKKLINTKQVKQWIRSGRHVPCS